MFRCQSKKAETFGMTLDRATLGVVVLRQCLSVGLDASSEGTGGLLKARRVGKETRLSGFHRTGAKKNEIQFRSRKGKPVLREHRRTSKSAGRAMRALFLFEQDENARKY
jgi:hypothetical protein